MTGFQRQIRLCKISCDLCPALNSCDRNMHLTLTLSNGRTSGLDFQNRPFGENDLWVITRQRPNGVVRWLPFRSGTCY